MKWPHYKIIIPSLKKTIDQEKRLLEAINIICDVGVNHYQEVINIAKRLNYDSRHLFNEATSGKEKLLQMKQSFEEAEHDEESTAQISVNICQNEENSKIQ